MTKPDIVAAIAPVVEAFAQLGVTYSISGSIASSAHGLARATLDIDVVAAMRKEQAGGLVDALHNYYYVDHDAIVDAIQAGTMFNLIHLETMLKVDVYILSKRRFDQESFGRRHRAPLGDVETAEECFILTPEDIILHKLEWYKMGGAVSERQWKDVIGVLQVQAEALDSSYLRRWANDLGVVELLDLALSQADLSKE